MVTEPIKCQEREFEYQQARARREAYEQQRAQGESQRRREWREQAQQESPSPSQKKASASSAGGSQRAKHPHDAYYHTMGLDPDGTYTKADLKRAYHQQAKKVHPDAGGTKEEFQKLSKAYELLFR